MEAQQEQQPALNYCYVLYNTSNSLTYVGYTNNLQKRIRQHNLEIQGGAIYTTRMVRKHSVKWQFLCALTYDSGDLTRNGALSIEWHLKHAARCKKGFRTHMGRLQSIPFTMANKKVMTMVPATGTLIVYVADQFLIPATQILQGYKVQPISSVTGLNNATTAAVTITPQFMPITEGQ